MGLSDGFEAKELGYRGTEDVKVKHAHACAFGGSEREGEVYWEEKMRSRIVRE
jgi:hypothetical protein